MHAQTKSWRGQLSRHGSGPRALPRARLVINAAVKKSSGKQVCKTSTLVAKPGSEEAVAKLLANVTTWSLDQARQRSNGIHVFEVVRDGWESNTFHTWERYESNAAMGRHTTSDTFKDFMEKVNPHLEGPVAMALYEWKDGAIGPVCMSAGPKGEGGLDDATGASGAAGGASLKQTSNSFNLSSDKDPSLTDDFLASSLSAAKKQMDGLKDMISKQGGLWGGLFGGKGKADAAGSEKGKEVAGRK